jgi:hypothetical protein
MERQCRGTRPLLHINYPSRQNDIPASGECFGGGVRLDCRSRKYKTSGNLR